MRVREPVERPLDVVAFELLLSASQAFLVGVVMYLAVGVWDDRGVGFGPVAVVLALLGVALGGAWLYWLLGGVGWPLAAVNVPIALFLGFAWLLAWQGEAVFSVEGVPLVLAILASVYGLVGGVFLDSPRRWRWDQRQRLRRGATVPRVSAGTSALVAQLPRSLPKRPTRSPAVAAGPGTWATRTAPADASSTGAGGDSAASQPPGGTSTPREPVAVPIEAGRTGAESVAPSGVAVDDAGRGRARSEAGTPGAAPAGSVGGVEPAAAAPATRVSTGTRPAVRRTPTPSPVLAAGPPDPGRAASVAAVGSGQAANRGAAIVAGVGSDAGLGSPTATAGDEGGTRGAIELPTSYEPKAQRSPWAWAAPPEWSRDEDDEPPRRGSSRRA